MPKTLPPMLEAMGVVEAPITRLPAGWVDRATEALRAAVGPGMLVCAEDVRRVAEANGLPPAPDGRGWGTVISRAKRKGWLVLAGKGYAPGTGLKLRVVKFWRAA